VRGYKVRISERRGAMPDVQLYAEGNDAPLDHDNGYFIADGSSDGDIFRPASFPDLTIPLADLWA
jgi:hypothetical protein